MRVRYQELFKKIKLLLNKKGIRQNDASLTAKYLLDADLKGYRGHGIKRLPQIIQGLDNKTTVAREKIKKISEFNAIACYDANHTIGQVAAHKAMNYAVKKANKFGIGVVGVINSSHIGALSSYSEISSSVKQIGLVMSVSSPAAVYYGGVKKSIGTNPISYSIPYEKKYLTADFSTTKTSRKKIIDAAKSNREMKDFCGVDSKGRFTKNAKEILEGGLITIDGGIKGSLISLLVSILAGPLINGVNNKDVVGTRFINEKPNKGDLFISIKVDRFGNYSDFSEKIKELLNDIEEQSIQFRAPGSKSIENMKLNNNKGIKVPSEVKQLLYDK